MFTKVLSNAISEVWLPVIGEKVVYGSIIYIINIFWGCNVLDAARSRRCHVNQFKLFSCLSLNKCTETTSNTEAKQQLRQMIREFFNLNCRTQRLKLKQALLRCPESIVLFIMRTKTIKLKNVVSG